MAGLITSTFIIPLLQPLNLKVCNFGIFPNWGQNIYVMPKEDRVWMEK